MTKSISFFTCLLIAVLFSACDNTINLAADWKDIPVVYAILDGSQPTQYVRLEKAFLDPEKSAVVVAQIPDSLYYDPAVVSVFLVNKRTGKSAILTRFDGTNEGFPRKPGIFANQPNWLYRVATSELGTLIGGDSIRVEVKRNDTNLPEVVATTRIPDKMEVKVADKFICKPSKDNTFSWEGDANALMFNAFFIIPTRRLDNMNQVISRDTVIWQVANNVERGTAQTAKGFVTAVTVPSIGFYEALAAKLTPITNADYRLFEKPSLLVIGGGREINEFQVSAAASSGVSGAEAVPIYTNVTNGLGLVTAINQNTGAQILIESATIDSVRVHPLTKDLKLN
jgi:hypothetical protein